MKLQFVNAVLLVAASVFVNVANAGLISGHHTTDDGKLVALQGLEWMSLDYTANLSRNDIEDGFTDQYGTTWAAGEWTYATRAQTENLLGSLWGGNYSGLSNDNSDGASWFIDNFSGLAFDTGFGVDRIDGKSNTGTVTNRDFSQFFFGSDLECNEFQAISTCIGRVEYAENFFLDFNAINVSTGNSELSYLSSSGPIGFLEESYGVDMGYDTINNSTVKHLGFTDVGSLLVRVAKVPEPSTIAIFSLALIGLVSRQVKS